MADLELKLDMSEVIQAHKELADTIEKRLETAVASLSIQTHAHIVEQANQRLHTRRQMFLDNLSINKVSRLTFEIVVHTEGRWIEDGMEAHSMLDDLLKSPKAKMSKDGKSKYLVVPFKHNKGPTQRTPAQTELLQSLKKELKQRQIQYGKIERNPDGSPKVGLLHKFNVQGSQKHRPQQGHEGPTGRDQAADVAENGQLGPHGRPYLWGVRIYQRQKRNADGSMKTGKDGHAMVERSIMTFRVASSKQEGTNKWFHPGTKPMHFLDEAFTWASEQWDSKIEPEILKELNIGH